MTGKTIFPPQTATTTCREYLGQEHGMCGKPVTEGSICCLEHHIERKQWWDEMTKKVNRNYERTYR